MMMTDQLFVEEALLARYYAIIDNLFVKTFTLTQGDERKSFDELLADMSQIETYTNTLKRKIPHFFTEKWRLNTWNTHPLRPIPRTLQLNYSISCFTQAFCKFHSILSDFPLLMPTNSSSIFRSLHLCEAPGAFIMSLALFLKHKAPEVSWQCFVNSLNPSYESNKSDALPFNDYLISNSSIRWLFGLDGSGNIFNWTKEYIDSIVHDGDKFHLITADGSFNCLNEPCNQERNTLPLFKKEIQIALSLLRPNGCFVIKFYTIYLRETFETLFELMKSFGNVHMFKPPASKPGNSEVYIICERFCSEERSHDEDETKAIWAAVYKCAKYFANFQCEMIQFNLDVFNHDCSQRFMRALKLAKEIAGETFLNKTSLSTLLDESVSVLHTMVKN